MESGLKRRKPDDSSPSKKRYLENLNSIEDSPKLTTKKSSTKKVFLKDTKPQDLFHKFFEKGNAITKSLFALKKSKQTKGSTTKKNNYNANSSDKEDTQDNENSSGNEDDQNFTISDLYCKLVKKSEKEIQIIEKKKIDKIEEESKEASPEKVDERLSLDSLFLTPITIKVPSSCKLQMTHKKKKHLADL